MRNTKTDEGAWINFPASYQTVKNIFSYLGEDDLLEIDAAETSVDYLHTHLKGKFFDTEKSRSELDFLSQRIEGLTDAEKDVFTAALNIEKPLSIMEIVNLSCNLDKFKLWNQVHDAKQLGMAVIEREQELSKTFALLLDAEQIGKAYQDSHAGWYSESGYVMRTGETLQVIYNGKALPSPDYDRMGIFQLRLYTSEYADTHSNNYCLSLPASEEKLEFARENLQVKDLSEVSIVSIRSSNTSLENYLPLDYQIEELNVFSQQLQKLNITDSESELEKLKVALIAEMPNDMKTVMEIMNNLNRYEILPEYIKTERDYAEFLIEKEKIYIDPQLEDYTDLDSFGEYRINHDGVIHTVHGLVVREERPIHPLTEYLEKIRLFSPLIANLYSKDEWGEPVEEVDEISPAQLCDYIEQILEQIQMEKLESEGERELAVYLEHRLLERKIFSMKPTVEIWNGELWGVLEVESYGSLSEKELEAVKEYWCGQESDGWGEGFEQCPIKLLEGELYVSFWNTSDDFFIATEEQLKQTNQDQSIQLGGM